MAKATTSKDKGLAARTRGDSEPLDAKVSSERDTSGDTSREEETVVAEDENDESVEDFAEERALSVTSGGSGQAVAHVAPRGVSSARVPDWAMGNPVTRFLAESYIELRKVNWPTRQEAWNMTLVVIVMSAVVALILSAADLGLSRLLTWIVGIGAGVR